MKFCSEKFYSASHPQFAPQKISLVSPLEAKGNLDVQLRLSELFTRVCSQINRRIPLITQNYRYFRAIKLRTNLLSSMRNFLLSKSTLEYVCHHNKYSSTYIIKFIREMINLFIKAGKKGRKIISLEDSISSIKYRYMYKEYLPFRV